MKNLKLCDINLFGVTDCKTVMLNLIILIARYYIFLCKIRKEKPTLAASKEKLKHFYDLEKEATSQQQGSSPLLKVKFQDFSR